jgi:3-dehydroquinate dehydratase
MVLHVYINDTAYTTHRQEGLVLDWVCADAALLVHNGTVLLQALLESAHWSVVVVDVLRCARVNSVIQLHTSNIHNKSHHNIT